MLHVLLLVLKIIGILLLVILGLILGLISLVLWVPVRYRMNGSYFEMLAGTVRITWLLHILSIVISFGEEIQVVVKLFGFPLFQGDKDEEVLEEEVKERALHAVELTKESLNDSVLQEPVRKNQTENLQAEEEKTRKQNLWVRLTEKIKFLFSAFCDRLRFINQKREQILEFLHNEENQITFRLIFKQTMHLLKHIRPQKISGSVVFGFDEPYTTGQVLSIASLFYAWYGAGVQITPVFDETVLEVKGTITGRIRLGTILVLAVRVLLNKNFRVLLKKWQSRGGVSDGR